MKKQGTNSSEVLMDITNGQGISLFAECAGANNATYPVMEGALAVCGKTVQIGHSIGKMTIDIHPWQMNGGYISGSNGPSGHGIYTNVSALMASGRIDMRKMVTGKLHLEDIKEGFVQASNGTSGKILISLTYPRKK
jgi:threonine dehydrogenase-like Zn-dependent dehydrogenase